MPSRSSLECRFHPGKQRSHSTIPRSLCLDGLWELPAPLVLETFYSLRECTRSRCQILLMTAREPGSTCPDSGVRQSKTQTGLGVGHSPGAPAGPTSQQREVGGDVERGSGPTLKPGVHNINIAFRLSCLGKMICIIRQIEKAWCFPRQVNKLVVERDGRRNTSVQ